MTGERGIAIQGDVIGSILITGDGNIVQGVTRLPTDYGTRIRNFLLEYTGSPWRPSSLPWAERKPSLKPSTPSRTWAAGGRSRGAAEVLKALRALGGSSSPGGVSEFTSQWSQRRQRFRIVVRGDTADGDQDGTIHLGLLSSRLPTLGSTRWKGIRVRRP